ncbi:hypothetical protein GCM10028824_36540 [Hymenobacter segetis]|uniref:Uncharacterized protein n=1 Tax=Hymenobacter segetis TaxID=2025509 RepID=A0ABU9LV82_9BACT
MSGSDPYNAFSLPGQQDKVTTIEPINREENAKLFAFSPEGLRNVCRRFGITDEKLEATLLDYVRPGEYAIEAERRAADIARVLGAIEAVVKSAPKHKAAMKGKQKGGATC